ncbi:MAG TPA: response regulator [Bryobacteraceae bacterium]|nr:response regulator [Bryobacteraceae bacterium]
MPASILIADSSPAMRAVIQRAIQIAGLPVSGCYQAGRAEDVLRLFESQQIDFLILDTHLAGAEGEELIQALRARREHAVPFLVTSVDASSARIERLLELGACDYLLKPFSAPTLCARLEQALNTLHANN